MCFLMFWKTKITSDEYLWCEDMSNCKYIYLNHCSIGDADWTAQLQLRAYANMIINIINILNQKNHIYIIFRG